MTTSQLTEFWVEIVVAGDWVPVGGPFYTKDRARQWGQHLRPGTVHRITEEHNKP